MEEILASIRRIIEDNDTGRKAEEATGETVPEAGGAPARPQLRPESAATVIEVGSFRPEARARSAPLDFPASGMRSEPSDGAAESAEAEVTAGASPPPEMRRDEPAHRTAETDVWRLGVAAPADEDDASDEIGDSIASAVMTDLAGPAAAGESDDPPRENRPALLSDSAGKQVAAAFGELSGALAARSRRNLDEMAESLLRPMLQDWLDNNLPGLVEKLVREEIERVARGP
jgi:hypothetical protein